MIIFISLFLSVFEYIFVNLQPAFEKAENLLSNKIFTNHRQ